MSKKDIDKSFLRDLHGVGEVKIDATDPNNLNNKILSERETRKRLLKHARIVGCERDMLLLFEKADNAMRNCSNAKERLDMGKLFATQIYFLLGGGGELIVNGEIVCKG